MDAEGGLNLALLPVPTPAFICDAHSLGGLGFERGKVGFMAAGLAVFAFPFFWDALAAS